MVSFPYDLKLTIGSTDYGFMLVSPPNQSKQLSIDEIQSPSGINELGRDNSPEARQHQDFDLKYDTTVSQASFAGGLGDYDFDLAGDGNTFWWGTGVVHVDGKVYCPPPTSTLTMTSGSTTWAGSTTFLSAAGTRYDFAWQGTRLYRRDASNGTNAWSLVYTAGFAITDCEVVDGAMLIATPTETNASKDWYYQADPTAGATWTPTAMNHTAFSNSLGKPKYFAKVRGTTFALVDNRKVFYTTDPSTDSWVGPIDTSLAGNNSGPPGDLSQVFTGAIPVNDYLFVFKRDAGYNIDSQQEVTEVLWQWKDRPSTSQFKYTAVGQDLLYFAVAPEVYAYDPATGRTMPVGLSKRHGFSIQDIKGVAADNQYTYILAQVRVPTLRSAASMALFRCWRTTYTTWSYEVIWEDTGATTYTGLYASPQGAGTRLYWFKDDGSASVHMDVPADWDESTGSSFATSAVMYTSVLRTGFPNFVKRWLWIASKTLGLSATETVNIAYSTNEGSSFTSLSTATAAGLRFDTFSSVNNETLLLRFTFASGGAATPILSVYDLHCRPRWRYLQQVKAAVRIADYVELQNGAKATEAATDLKTNLETLRTSDSTITYTDFLGNSFSCSLDNIAYHPSRHESPERSANGIYELEAALTIGRADKGA